MTGGSAAPTGVSSPPVTITYEWHGDFANDEINRLHAEAFGTEVFDDWDWRAQVAGHSLGWVVAHEGKALVGFVNVVWDGLVHAWIQDRAASGPSTGGLNRAGRRATVLPGCRL